MPAPLPDRQRYAAYAVILMPIAWSAAGSVPYPVPNDMAARFIVVLAFAIGASLFVVRRRRNDLIGWLGLCIWGGLCLVAVASAVWRNRN